METHKGPSDHRETLCHQEGDRALARVAQAGWGASTSLEISKTCLDTFPGKRLWVALLEHGVGPDDLQRLLPTTAALGFCSTDPAHPPSTRAHLQECSVGNGAAVPKQ